jgi:acyl-coenzyme A synthetase/AMP-(fatty) acid ligase
VTVASGTSATGGAAGARTVFRDVVTQPERRAEYLRAGFWDGSTLGHAAAAHARAAPDRLAVIDREGRRATTYGTLLADAHRLAQWMRSREVVPGDLISVQLPNWYETVVVAIAAQLAGAVVNPLLPDYRVRELAYVFGTARPKLLFSPASYRDCDHVQLARDAMRAANVALAHVVVGEPAADGCYRWEEATEGQGAASLPEPLQADGLAGRVSELIFTSGTEAVPKAIMHTEDTANFSVRTAFTDLGMGESDVVWMPSPLGHSTGFNYGLRLALYHGLRLVLQDRWHPETAVDLITSQGCTYTLSATTFLQDLVAEAVRRDAQLPMLRLFGCGGAPVPPPLVAQASEVGIGVLRLYGSTEALVATWNRPGSPRTARMETDGIAMSNVELDVRDDDGRACPPGLAGEIYVRGPGTCVGFFADPERTAATFSNGWVRSGDLGVKDADGYLCIVGRRKEIIIRGGFNIAPREIEELLIQFPEVRQAAVLGVADRRLGERICACVVLRAGAQLDLGTLRARLRAAGLAGFKVPETLRIVDTIPMTASGKVQKHLLAAQLEPSGAGPH